MSVGRRESVQQTRSAQQGEAVGHLAPRQQDGRGSTRESLREQRRHSENEKSPHGSAYASVASQVARDATVWCAELWTAVLVALKIREGEGRQFSVEGQRHVQSQRSGQLVGEGETGTCRR